MMTNPISVMTATVPRLIEEIEGMVCGVVRSGRTPQGNLWAGFYLTSPITSNDTLLYSIIYPPTFYPLTLHDGDGVQGVANSLQLEEVLKRVMCSARTRIVIALMVKQAKTALEMDANPSAMLKGSL